VNVAELEVVQNLLEDTVLLGRPMALRLLAQQNE
jgi:hypothetical protein